MQSWLILAQADLGGWFGAGETFGTEGMVSKMENFFFRLDKEGTSNLVVIFGRRRDFL